MRRRMHSPRSLVISTVIIFIILWIATPTYTGIASNQQDNIFKSMDQAGFLPQYQNSSKALIPQLFSSVIFKPQEFDAHQRSEPSLTSITSVPAMSAHSNLYQSNQPQAASYTHLPLVFSTEFSSPLPSETVLFCDNIGSSIPIPDNDPNGINSDIVIADGRYLENLSLYLNITHQAVGNLVVKLSNQDTGEKITVISYPGNPPSQCSTNNILAILDDRAAQSVDEQCATAPAAISGIFRGTDSLAEFTRQSVSGTWRLNVSDQKTSNTGTLNHWCLKADLSDQIPAPIPPPTPVELPSSAYVDGMWGEDQSLKLDCESRSAVDWARHFGDYIDELDFLSNLPRSDDPEVGFVGDPNGIPGQIPPEDYGVHAPPVAQLLNEYGLEAEARQYLSWNDLRASIANNHPVIVWIISASSYSLRNGVPILYTPESTKKPTVVASSEHTVIVTGYNPSYVQILNGSHFVDIPIDQFLDSWSVLQFQAVLFPP